MTHDEIIRMERKRDNKLLQMIHRSFPSIPISDDDAWRRLLEFANAVYAEGAAAERERLHDKFMQIHHSQQHSNNYWHFAARKIKEEA